jgi:hypothetical protein
MACCYVRLTLAPLLFCLSLPGATPAGQARAAFQSPPEDARMLMRWWWFGPAVTATELEKEILQMKAAGIGGFEVQPVYPLAVDNPAQGLENLRYLSPRFLEMVRFTGEKARQYGMRMDITLGSGWPYGGPHITRELAAGQMKFSLHPVPGKTGQMVKRPSFGAEGFVLDHYNRAALDRHLEVVADKLAAAAGPGRITAAFCDSLEVYGANWTTRLPEEFARRRGYTLTPYLSNWTAATPEAAAVRCDFGRTLSELYQENFLAPLAAWSKAQGMRLRMQNYGTPPATLASNRLVDLPEGEGWHWRRFTTTRWASSASHLLGKPVTSSETWTWNHSPVFRATPLDLKGEADQHILCGINQFVGHGWPYSAPQAAEPGWSLYAASALNPHNPWWPVMPDLALYLQRLSAVLRLGAPVADVGLYLPTLDAWASFTTPDVDLWKKLSARVNDVVPAILDAGFNFDAFDDGTATEALTRFKLIVLPGVERLPLETLASLEKFAAAGGKVIAVKRLPEFAGGLKEQPANAELARRARALLGSALPLDQFPAALQAACTPDIRSRGFDGQFGFVHRRLASADLYFVANTSNRPRQVALTFRSTYRQAEQWDPVTGETRALPPGAHQTLTLAPYGSTLVYFSARRQAPAPPLAPADSIDLTPGSPLGFVTGADPLTYTRTVTLHALPATALLDFGPSQPAADTDLGGQPANQATFVARLLPPVRDAAEVWVNGRRAGALWCPPYRLDIAKLLKAGENRIEVRVFPTAANGMASRPKPDYAALEARFGRRFEMQDLDRLRMEPYGLSGPITLRIGKR